MKYLAHALAASAVLSVSGLQGAAIVQNYSSGPLNLGIPDGNPSGLSNVINVTSSSISNIADISVTLNVSGTHNGDIYAYLQHGSGLAVLLNRPGRGTGISFGNSNDGLQVTLNDLGAFSDIHNADSGGGLLSGTFTSDGRSTDPNDVLDTDARDATLTGFFGEDADGGWTLFVADLSGGDSHTLESWSIELTAIPEPGTSLLLLLGGSLLARRRR